MDELEISGKRYISTRRAGKDYKYHSDYIGQLVRSKKVLGQKVGRAWYIEAESLANYFNKENAVAPIVEVEPVVAVEVNTVEVAQPEAEVAQVEIPVVAEPEVVAVQPELVAQESEPEVTVPTQEKPVSVFDSIHIPIRRTQTKAPVEKNIGLTYIEEDEIASVPEIHKRYMGESSITSQTQNQDESYSKEEKAPERVYKREKNSILPVLSIVCAGLLVFGVVVSGSMLVSSHTVVEAGKAASVGYTFH